MVQQLPKPLIDLYNVYIHGGMSRREFMEGIEKFAVGGLTVAAISGALMPNYALGEVVPKNDSRLKIETVTVPSPQGNTNIKGQFARPASAAATAKLPGILVVHENRGLNPHIEDIGRRLALEGFNTFAPDGLTSVGGYPGDDEKAAQLFSSLDAAKRTEDLLAAVPFLSSRAESTGDVGAVGFCFGGGIVNQMAVRFPELDAAVPFYGPQPSAADTAKIKAPLLIHYAGEDSRINAGWPAWEQALKQNRVRYRAYTYPGVQHGFHNDTTPRYDEATAKLAWSRTLAFFRETLNA